MKALCWHGTGDVRVDTVPDPEIRNPRDAIIKITASAICGSDLHLFNGFMPTMEAGDILGHEPMGEVVELGSGVSNLEVGHGVVVPFTISCGSCLFCEKTLFSCCDTSNPNAEIARKAMGHSPAALLGYSHMLDGFPGGQAEYLRVPFADVGPLKIESGLLDSVMDKVKAAVMLTTDRAHVLRQAIMCCRKGGTISVPGAYVGAPDEIPMGAFMNKGLTMKSGQTHMQRYMKPLREKIEAGAIEPSFVITHKVKLADAPEAYKTFRDKKDGCIKVVLQP